MCLPSSVRIYNCCLTDLASIYRESKGQREPLLMLTPTSATLSPLARGKQLTPVGGMQVLLVTYHLYRSLALYPPRLRALTCFMDTYLALSRLSPTMITANPGTVLCFDLIRSTSRRTCARVANHEARKKRAWRQTENLSSQAKKKHGGRPRPPPARAASRHRPKQTNTPCFLLHGRRVPAHD